MNNKVAIYITLTIHEKCDKCNLMILFHYIIHFNKGKKHFFLIQVLQIA